MKTIGIVLISYNASDAVRVTLDSLKRAYNRHQYRLILVDNASSPIEREKIKKAFDFHSNQSWQYIQQDTNLGFSGGNNIGISKFLKDSEISSICLLNSDVIVTDYWLDRLIDVDFEIVSAVTNKADSEQCVPINYELNLRDCFDFKNEKIKDSSYELVKNFAESWHKAWSGNIVEADVTFFCVLIARRVFEAVGMLDANFFPGGFEDDDYCIRARQKGFKIFLARDVFIHHWGSASFGQLQYEYFSDKAQKNKNYLEKKHKIVWARRPEKPIVSFAMDISYALKSSSLSITQRVFIASYIKSLDTSIRHYENEFNNLVNEYNHSQIPPSDKISAKIDQASSYGDLIDLWNKIVAEVELDFSTGNNQQHILEKLNILASAIRAKVDVTLLVHAYLYKNHPDKLNERSLNTFYSSLKQTFGKGLNRLKLLAKALRFIKNFDGIVFFGGYFYPERQSDGYFQRIQIVDRLFSDRWRIYVESDELRGRDVWFDRPESKVIVLRVIGSKKRRAFVKFLTLMAVVRSRRVYFHSVLRMYDNKFGFLLHLPGITKIVDIHGVVPEEFRMHNDFFSAVIFEKEERLAVSKADAVIVVTDAMKQYLQQKYRSELRASVISFPMFPDFSPNLDARPMIDGKPIVVYAGGLHKWQQVPKMIDTIERTIESYKYRFYCSQPEVVLKMMSEEVGRKVEMGSKTHEQLVPLYAECHYGFVLREDLVVNHVACPTKLVEYLAMGIVPIVDSEDIGDFKSLGMQFISLNHFLKGNIPNEATRLEMAQANGLVYEKLKSVRQIGAVNIYNFFTKKKHPAIPGFLDKAYLITKLFSKFFLKIKLLNSEISELLKGESIGSLCQYVSKKCDILVQVDNFEAGGLENVVIDLNSTLSNSGYKVVLLVQGTCGDGFYKSKELGMEVIAERFSEGTYKKIIDELNPKVVIAHYSFDGADYCKNKNIPFIQVIHNLYMWFDNKLHQKFLESAKSTSIFVAVSEEVKKYSISKLGVEENKCLVINNGIDFSVFDNVDTIKARKNLRERFGVSDNNFLFLDVGSINHQKNHLAVVKAFDKLQRFHCSNVRLAILGPVYEKGLLEEIKIYIKEQGLCQKVFYCGAVKEAHEYFFMADAFVSGTFFEGGPLTLLEGIKANLPIIMPRTGLANNFIGLPGFEVIEPAVDMVEFNGSIWELKFPDKFIEDLAQAMLKVMINPAKPNFSEEQLSEIKKERTYSKYIDLIETVLSVKA